MRPFWPLLAALALCLGLTRPAPAEEQETPTIASLIAQGWKVVGYTAQGTTYILFAREGQDHLVQCSVLYDTTRGAKASERVKTNCYDLK
jgi:hypothetical protein